MSPPQQIIDHRVRGPDDLRQAGIASADQHDAAVVAARGLGERALARRRTGSAALALIEALARDRSELCPIQTQRFRLQQQAFARSELADLPAVLDQFPLERRAALMQASLRFH